MSALREELENIRLRFGALTPARVVQVAENPDHPLHDRFVWDDTEAARCYRIDQARNLIRSVRVVYKEATVTDEARSVRVYHNVEQPDGTRTYEPTDEIVRSPLMAKMVLAQMERDWIDLRRRYEHFGEFWELVANDHGLSD